MTHEYRVLSTAGSAMSERVMDIEAFEGQINKAAQEGFRVCQMSSHARPAAMVGKQTGKIHTDLTGIVVIMEREVPA